MWINVLVFQKYNEATMECLLFQSELIKLLMSFNISLKTKGEIKIFFVYFLPKIVIQICSNII